MYGHVLCGKEDSALKVGLNVEVIGTRSKGRLNQRWSDLLDMEMKAAAYPIIKTRNEKDGRKAPEKRPMMK